ncbi:MAG: NUDIX domain-containing protein [Bacilli bacterium]|nr:NUDIX domain-containing protein [Bacilli bacterium]
MDKRISSRAIIIKDNKLLVFFRRKVIDGVTHEYYSLPGGGLEKGESLYENVKREVNEEMGIDIEILGYVGKSEDEKSIQYFFHAKRVKGTPVLGGEELERMSENNYYEVRYLDIDNLDNENLSAKDMVRKALNEEYSELK